jgi:hypothetical protein
MAASFSWWCLRGLQYADHVSIGTLYITSARYKVCVLFSFLRLTEQKEVDIIARYVIVEWSR